MLLILDGGSFNFVLESTGIEDNNNSSTHKFFLLNKLLAHFNYVYLGQIMRQSENHSKITKRNNKI